MDKLLSGRRVLVVEDEMLVLIMIEDMLADLGCKSVTSAATVDKAIALINTQVFDIVLLDMNLNGNDSHPVAEALSARGVPFVYSTGSTGQSSRDGYSDHPVLKKPFNMRNSPRYFPASSSRRSSNSIVKRGAALRLMQINLGSSTPRSMPLYFNRGGNKSPKAKRDSASPQS